MGEEFKDVAEKPKATDAVESKLPTQVATLAQEGQNLKELSRLNYGYKADTDNDGKLTKDELQRLKPETMDEVAARNYALKNFDKLSKGDDSISRQDISKREQEITSEAVLSLSELGKNGKIPNLDKSTLYSLGEGIPLDPDKANAFKDQLNEELKKKGITGGSLDIFDVDLKDEGVTIGGGTDYVLYWVADDGTKTPVARKGVERLRC